MNNVNKNRPVNFKEVILAQFCANQEDFCIKILTNSFTKKNMSHIFDKYFDCKDIVKNIENLNNFCKDVKTSRKIQKNNYNKTKITKI